MCCAERNTFRRGRCCVPDTFARTRRCRRCRAVSALRTFSRCMGIDLPLLHSVPIAVGRCRSRAERQGLRAEWTLPTQHSALSTQHYFFAALPVLPALRRV